HASSFDSTLFPGRHVPDVCGLVGQDVGGRAPLLMLPVAPGSDLDRELAAPGAGGAPADGTAPDDGWALLSGTSSAAPQVAGAAALALQLRPELSPAEVRALLAAHVRDVSTGASATGDLAGPGPDAATGAGLIDVAGLVRSLPGPKD
ncbi:MAG: peptidase S8, partial [Chloroflexi bacterium]